MAYAKFPSLFIKLQLLFAVELVCLSYSSLALSDTVTLVADEWCPYNCAPRTQSRGFMVEVAEIAFSKAGHSVEYTTMPWSRAIDESRAGAFSGIIGAFKDDAPDFIFPEIAISDSSRDFYVRSDDSWNYTDLSSLKGVAVGVIRDYSYGNIFDAYVKKHINQPGLIQVSSGDDALATNVKKLLARRIRVLVEDPAVLSYYLSKSRLSDKVKFAGSLGADKIYIAFSPKNPKSTEYAKILSDSTSELRQNGKLKEILRRYGVSESALPSSPAAAQENSHL